MQIVTETDFTKNLKEYLNVVSNEEIVVTRDGRAVYKIIPTNTSAVKSIKGILKGKVPESLDKHSIKEERLGNI